MTWSPTVPRPLTNGSIDITYEQHRRSRYIPFPCNPSSHLEPPKVTMFGLSPRRCSCKGNNKHQTTGPPSSKLKNHRAVFLGPHLVVPQTNGAVPMEADSKPALTEPSAPPGEPSSNPAQMSSKKRARVDGSIGQST
ncbi:hypothetical protein D9756_006906 [Leucocoprinus leucothites]|uniref:Uncharacterized protein n=1 Tax=Leucocoprinus leucothites TaxID=201217 RepID=A0A8H5D693_9AGAR|nr:hypothetical protein D9756_006906 [Leucoagaricus leucothites]